MESQAQNPEFTNNPENFYPCSTGSNQEDSKMSLHDCFFFFTSM